MLKVLNIFKFFKPKGVVKEVNFPQLNPGNTLTNFPELMKYWDKEKNVISTEGLTINSNKLVHWSCSCGNEWELEIKNMNKRKFKCQKCKKENNVEGKEN